MLVGKEVLFPLFCFELPLSSGVSALSGFGGQETPTEVAEVSSFKKPERDVPSGAGLMVQKGPGCSLKQSPGGPSPAG